MYRNISITHTQTHTTYIHLTTSFCTLFMHFGVHMLQILQFHAILVTLHNQSTLFAPKAKGKLVQQGSTQASAASRVDLPIVTKGDIRTDYTVPWCLDTSFFLLVFFYTSQNQVEIKDPGRFKEGQNISTAGNTMQGEGRSLKQK